MNRKLSTDGSSADRNSLRRPPTLGEAMHRQPFLSAYTGAAEHVLRHANGELIDDPSLVHTGRGTPWRWTAIVWPDPTRFDGWGVLEWQRGARGWILPGTLLLGDVIEFGVVGVDPHGQPIPDTAHRWYGWLTRFTRVAAIVTGPYGDALSAYRAAQPLVDEIRCSQLLLGEASDVGLTTELWGTDT